ncbi:MAG: LacI family DNA-binding transcriptional regulator [Lentisphaeria bacterium]|nr:LacI family DNA-binding transcriptional regulator [Lentisphaeria bacterium]
MEVKININTIAKTARVSTTTVSNFINGTEVFPISRDTRGRVKDAMRKLNYRPHIGGILMRRNLPRRGRVGFVMGEDCRSPILHTSGIPLVQRFLRELETALDERLDMALEIVRVADEDSREHWNARLLDLDCVVNYGQLHSLLCDSLYRRNLPMIEVYSAETFRRRGDFSGIEEEFDFLYWRNDRQIEKLFDYFYSLGKRSFIFVSSCNVKALRPDYYGYDAEMKLEGFKRALAAHPDCTGTILSPRNAGDFDMFREFSLTRELLMREKELLARADAVICHNDIVAQGAAATALELGRRPGEDILFSGEGDFREFQHWHPAIATSSVDYAELTDRLCALIRKRIADRSGEPCRTEIPTLLIQR